MISRSSLFKNAGLEESTITAVSQLGIPEDLIAALVFAESGGFRDAIRYEKGYLWTREEALFAHKNKISTATELVLQQMSFGPLQLMGANARVLGYEGPLTQLLDPPTGLRWGARFFMTLRVKYETFEEAISAYNQGSPRKHTDGKFKNQDYVDKVRAAWDFYERN